LKTCSKRKRYAIIITNNSLLFRRFCSCQSFVKSCFFSLSLCVRLFLFLLSSDERSDVSLASLARCSCVLRANTRHAKQNSFTNSNTNTCT
jgi:hypothetical protein